MNDFIDLIISKLMDNITTITSTFFGIWGLTLKIKDYRIKNKEHNSKKSNFSLYLKDSFRTHNNNKTFIAFHLEITNHANSKNSFTSYLHLSYLTKDDIQKKVKLKHNSSSHIDIPKKNLTILNTTIKLDEKEIKSGWLIFPLPSELNDIRLNEFIVCLIDSSGNAKEHSSTLMINLT